MNKYYFAHISLIFFAFIFCIGSNLYGQSFNATGLIGENLSNPTSLDFGPDGKLYVSQQDGKILQYSIIRDGASPGNGNYSVSSTSTINLIKNNVPNHNDDGTNNSTQQRQVTGVFATGTAANPVLYVSSSDWRISVGVDSGLDTNSGVLSKLTWNGSAWIKIDLVRGLPRCEENHSTNGMDIFTKNNNTYLLLQQGGNTNKGAPSNNFAGTSETFLSSSILIINLTQLEGMPVYTDPRSNTNYVYDLPTLDDPTRNNITNSDSNFPYPLGHPMYDASIDVGDPFGGNNSLNQAITEAGGPVQVFSPGYRNAYDVVVTQNNKIYTVDNGPNTNWGGTPVVYNSDGTVKTTIGILDPSSNDYITNDLNENGSTVIGDALHLVGTINDVNGNYYGGHPVPIRAFPSRAVVRKYEKNGSIWTSVPPLGFNFSDLLLGVRGYFKTSFSINDFPDDNRQGEYLSGNENNSKVNILDVINSSTNGICEYTATNFGGVMQGNILTASFNGAINRYILNASGDDFTNEGNTSLFSGFGSQPLDVIAQGDNDPFPGTIWAATYGADNITVFEPTDFTNECISDPNHPNFVAMDDSDSDGYNNQDEVDNGTNPCNGGDMPNDNDGDLVSDLNDMDDDNDGILDLNDAFQWDSNNGNSANLPISYPFWNNDPGTGYAGLGFTGWMINGQTDYLETFDPENLAFGGAGGAATLELVNEGDAYEGLNTQHNAFQFGVNVDNTSPSFTVHSRLLGPFFGNPSVNPLDFASQGIYIGTGDQDNFLKVVVNRGLASGGSISGIEVALESNGIANGTFYDLFDLTAIGSSIDLYIAINPIQGTAQPYYSIDGGTSVISIGGEINLPPSFLDPNDSKGMAVGIISTSTGAAPEFAATWDFINVTPDGAGAELRFNAGGTTIEHSGLEFITDANFIGGQAYINTQAQVPELYQTERSSPTQTFQYNIPLANGDYTVILHFAEIFWGATGGGSGGVGKRIFDVNIEGNLVMNDYDIYADVGAETVVTKSFNITISDGALNMNFSALSGVGGVNQPKLSAFEIYENNSQYPPIDVVAIPDQINGEGDISNLSVTASGGNPEANFTYSISGQPAGIDIESTNGQIYGTIANDTNGEYSVSVTVNKPGSAAASIGFNWTITGVLCNLNDLSDSNYSRFQTRNEILGDKIYVMGGWMSGPPVQSNTHLEIYDISNDNWGIGADLLLPVTHMGSVVVGTEIWLLGGFVGNLGNPTVLTEKVQIYNTLTNTWSYGPDLPKAIGSGAATLNGNKVHYFGGLDPDIQTNIGDHYVLDLNNMGAGWTTAAPMPNPRNHHAAETVNGIIYAIGGQLGHQGAKQDVDFVEAYDANTNSWTSVADLPIARSHFESGTTVHNGKIIIVGGQEETSNYSNEITQYDPLTNEWTELCNLPDNRLSPVAQVYGDQLIVSGGGINGSSNLIPTTQWLQLDPTISQLTWTDKNENENYTGRHECNFVQVGDKFFLLGGRESDLVQRYDYLADSWLTMSSAPKFFSHFQAIEYQGLIWVIGAIEGNNYPYDIPNNYIWIFNPLTDEWIQGPEIPLGRVRGSTGAILYNDKFYIVGGNTNGHAGGYVSWFDEYDPVTGIWTTLPNAPNARDHFHAVLVGDELYAVGGRQTGDPGDANQTPLELGKPQVASVDVYNFTTGLWKTLPVSQNLPTPRAGAAAVNFNDKIVVLGGEVYLENVYGAPNTTGALKITEQFDPITGVWTRLDDLNYQRHGQQAIVSGNGIHVVAGSPVKSGGQQKNMEFYGEDNPVGNSITTSDLIAPETIYFDTANIQDFNLEVENGDTGKWIRSMEITGPDAGDFTLLNGQLENQLLIANSSHQLSIEFNGSGTDKNALLTINYGVANTLNIALVKALPCNWNDLSDSNYSRFQTRNEILGDKIYVMGGWMSGPPVQSNTHLEIYDITNDNWGIGADLLLPVTHMGSVVVGTEIWLLGGFVGNLGNPTVLTEKVQIYNTLTNTWSYGPDLPKAIGSGAATLNGNKVHYFGGLDPDIQTNIGDHYVLDLNNMGAGWTTAAPMLNPRNHHAAETVNGIIYAIGGQLGHQGAKQDVDFVEAYDANTNSWTSVAVLPIARSHFESGTTVHNGKIIIVGGQEETSNYSNEITQYDPLTNEWTELCNLPDNRLSPVAQVYGDQLIVSGGGINGSSNLIPTTQWLQLELNTTQYDLTVNNGSGDGQYASGAMVGIIADPAPTGQEFDVWTGDVGGIADIGSASTSITMPSSNVVVSATYKAVTNGTVWLEDFSDLSNGTKIDNGSTAWTSSRDSGIFEVTNGAFRTNGNSTDPGVWTSEVIDINGTVSISMDVDDADNNKEPADFVRAFYKVDGGAQIAFGSVTDDISPQSFTASNISGNTIQIIVETKVSTTTETYLFDNISVLGTTGTTQYDLTVNNGSGDGQYASGAMVGIIADPAPTGQEFDVWTGDVGGIADIGSASTSITMPSSNVVVSATYKAVTNGTVWLEDFSDLSNGTKIDNGSTAWTSSRDSGIFEVTNGAFRTNGNSTDPGLWTSEVIDINGTVSISMDVDDADNNKEPADFVRAFYKVDGGAQIAFGSVTDDISPQSFTASNISGNTIQIIVETKVSTTTETYLFDNISVLGTTGTTQYDLTVNNGSGDGQYASGAMVGIIADPAPTGQEFDVWTGDVGGIADIGSASTSITMPSSNVVVSATYKAVTNGTVWLEDFSDLSNGTKIDNGSTAWTSSRDSGIFEVTNGAFRTNGNSTDPGLWTSEVIDINGTVSISIDVDDADNNKEPADFVRAFYKVDGGAQIAFGSVTDDISPQSFTASNISGNTIQIIVETKVSTATETYFFDNVKVTNEVVNPVSAKSSLDNKSFFEEFSSTNHRIKVYPNPATLFTQIAISDPSIIIKNIYIRDISGRLIAQYDAAEMKKGKGVYEFNVAGLENGVYFVSLMNGSTMIMNYKLIVKK